MSPDTAIPFSRCAFSHPLPTCPRSAQAIVASGATWDEAMWLVAIGFRESSYRLNAVWETAGLALRLSTPGRAGRVLTDVGACTRIALPRSASAALCPCAALAAYAGAPCGSKIAGASPETETGFDGGCSPCRDEDRKGRWPMTAPDTGASPRPSSAVVRSTVRCSGALPRLQRWVLSRRRPRPSHAHLVRALQSRGPQGELGHHRKHRRTTPRLDARWRCPALRGHVRSCGRRLEGAHTVSFNSDSSGWIDRRAGVPVTDEDDEVPCERAGRTARSRRLLGMKADVIRRGNPAEAPSRRSRRA